MSAPEDPPLYQYDPIETGDRIRIIVLEPASARDDPLQADIREIDCGPTRFGNIGYEAVSYCWGDAQKTRNLPCTGGKIVPITRNVDTMLRFLRKKGERRHLWIDAICINQEDNAEKDVQVRLMNKVYMYASKTHIWLGDTSEEADVQLLLSGLRSVAILALQPDIESEVVQRTLQDICGSDYSTHLNWFLERPWFRRRWVIQECFFSQHSIIRCGLNKITYNVFIRAIKLLLDHKISMSSISHESSMVVTSIPTVVNQSFLDLLWNFDKSQCTLPQDRIFALYSIAKGSEDMRFVYYGQEWTDTFIHIATELYEQDPARAIEHLAAFGPLRFRSWVPDWRNARVPLNVRFLDDHGGRNTTSSAYVTGSRKRMFMNCYYRGRVEHVMSPLIPSAQHGSLLVISDLQKNLYLDYTWQKKRDFWILADAWLKDERDDRPEGINISELERLAQEFEEKLRNDTQHSMCSPAIGPTNTRPGDGILFCSENASSPVFSWGFVFRAAGYHPDDDEDPFPNESGSSLNIDPEKHTPRYLGTIIGLCFFKSRTKMHKIEVEIG